jgi:hypothetical protein
MPTKDVVEGFQKSGMWQGGAHICTLSRQAGALRRRETRIVIVRELWPVLHGNNFVSVVVAGWVCQSLADEWDDTIYWGRDRSLRLKGRCIRS